MSTAAAGCTQCSDTTIHSNTGCSRQAEHPAAEAVLTGTESSRTHCARRALASSSRSFNSASGSRAAHSTCVQISWVSAVSLVSVLLSLAELAVQIHWARCCSASSSRSFSSASGSSAAHSTQFRLAGDQQHLLSKLLKSTLPGAPWPPRPAASAQQVWVQRCTVHTAFS